MLINSVKDVASALGDLIHATKSASGKSINDPAMIYLKDSAKVRFFRIQKWYLVPVHHHSFFKNPLCNPDNLWYIYSLHWSYIGFQYDTGICDWLLSLHRVVSRVGWTFLWFGFNTFILVIDGGGGVDRTLLSLSGGFDTFAPTTKSPNKVCTSLSLKAVVFPW